MSKNYPSWNRPTSRGRTREIEFRPRDSRDKDFHRSPNIYQSHSKLYESFMSDVNTNTKQHDSINRKSGTDITSTLTKKLSDFSSDNASRSCKSNKQIFLMEGVRQVLLEDCRISKLVRILLKEDDPTRFLPISKQLQEALFYPDNNRYVKKAADDLIESILDTIHSGPTLECRYEAAKCLGRVGYIMENDFKKFMNWVFDRFATATKDETRVLLMKAIHETLKMEEGKIKLKEFAPELVTRLQSVLENTDTPDLLVATVENLILLTTIYPTVFTSHFKDTVDILVGWHIDASQSNSLIDYTSQALQYLHPYWIEDMQFTLNLLGQFLEDMEAYAEDLTLPRSGRSSPGDESPTSPEECIAKITSLLRVFTTVGKSLGAQLSPSQNNFITWSFLNECLMKVLRSVTITMDYQVDEDLLISTNSCICLLIHHLQSKAAKINGLYDIIYKQLQLSTEMSEICCLSLINLITIIVKEFGGNLSLDLVQKLLEPGSAILQLRFKTSKQVQTDSLKLYHHILNLKNIPLLQEAYTYILGELEVHYNLLNPIEELVSPNPFAQVKCSLEDCDKVVLFILTALSDIANAKNSIIGMWALKPSIFDLLSSSLHPLENKLALNSPGIQFSILYLLYSHCSRHSHFIGSSSLISNLKKARESPSISSPIILPETSSANSTCSHLGIILTHLANLLNNHYLSNDSICLAIQWAREVIEQSLPYLPYISRVTQFSTMIEGIIYLGTSLSSRVSLAALNCIKFLIDTHTVSTQDVVKSVIDVCFINLGNRCPTIRESYLNLLISIPIENLMLLMRQNFYLEVPCNYSSKLGPETQFLQCKEIMTKQTLTVFHSHNFSLMMTYLLSGPSEKSCPACLDVLFETCVPKLKLGSDLPHNINMTWFTALWEATHFCVLSKLRTPLGKPQETFTTIEATIKSLAKSTHNYFGYSSGGDIEPKKSSSQFLILDNIGNGVFQQPRIILLLQFLENLEKLIYNAAEGCAVALPTYPKNVRAFFRTNRSTCAEWLNRIRVSIIQIALLINMWETAIRHGQALLQDLQDSDNMQGIEFERAVLYLVEAYIGLHNSDTLIGLYQFCKETAGRRFTWIKSAIEHASNRLEDAASQYKSLLVSDFLSEKLDSMANIQYTKENLDTMSKSFSDAPDEMKQDQETGILGFINRQLGACYTSLGMWEEFLAWKDTEELLLSTYACPQSFLTVQSSYILIRSHFEQQEFDKVKTSLRFITESLSSWDESLDTELPIISDSGWDPVKRLNAIETLLMFTASSIGNDEYDCDLRRLVDYCSEKLKDHMYLACTYWPPYVQPILLLLQSVVQQLGDCIKYDQMGWSFLKHCETFKVEGYPLEVLYSSLTWSEAFLALYPSNTELSKMRDVLKLKSAKLSRKSQNLRLAQRLLIGSSREDWDKLCTMLASNDSPSLSDVLYVQECSKTLYSLGQPESAICTMGQLVQDLLMKSVKPGSELSECLSRSMLTIAKWLQQDAIKLSDSVYSSTYEKPLNRIDTILSSIVKLKVTNQEEFAGFNGICKNMNIPGNEETVGYLLHKSVQVCPFLAKCWMQLAQWSYKWGRKAVDGWHDGTIELTSEEEKKMLNHIPDDLDLVNVREIKLSLCSNRAVIPEDSEEVKEDCEDVEAIQKQLMSCCDSFKKLSIDSVRGLAETYHDIKTRVFSYYKIAAKSYFQYLQIKSEGGNEVNSEDGNITATLRLLRLIVKHAHELREELEMGLAATPTKPWKCIIPQLFARLNHPQSYVRKSLSELLCRVAQDSPHLIVFPAVVGASGVRGGRDNTDLFENYLQTVTGEEESEDLESQMAAGIEISEQEEQEQEEEEDSKQSSMMQNSFLAMVDTLSKQNPQVIFQVKTLVNELQRITLLWDELWLGTLNQHHGDIQKRLAQLEAEVSRVRDNGSLSDTDKYTLLHKKFEIIFKPVLFVLEHMENITMSTPETPHEKWFQDTYGDLIKEALTAVRQASPEMTPQQAWHPLRSLQHQLNQRAQRRMSLLLKMSEISPVLFEMKNTCVALPGISSKKPQVVTIESVENHVSIIPTKTKPKKLIFKGSDGKKYAYLFKGLEDLHLDERIMQFLNIVNSMLTKNSVAEKRAFRARHYSVIPLGPRSGLIQWVEGATPLFGLYKRWQQREAAAQSLKGSSTTHNHQMSRPSEIFYSKLTPLLKEKGISNTDNRKDWPLSVLRQVLLELMASTPKDLLARELWCSSVSSSNWWQITETYNQSTAVMSVIGYIIGLGDRHLDNVLVDLASGEVVHIDYNVCFEKGKNLRVPEKVPFRMTPNIETALGVTGIEGMFRLSCEHVLKIMRKGRETLLTLLEAFVYDPLIDWTPAHETGYAGAVYGGGHIITNEGKKTRKELERELTLSMFSVRIFEMEASWFSNRDDIIEAFDNILLFLNNWVDEHHKLSSLEDKIQDYHQELALLKEAEVNQAHSLYTLHSRYARFKVVKDSFELAKMSVREKLDEQEKWDKLHKMGLSAIKGPLLPQWCSDIANNYFLEDSKLLCEVKEFLRQAGQSQLADQCKVIEEELRNQIRQQQTVLSNCLDLLTHYTTVYAHYPVSVLSQHRTTLYIYWLQSLLQDFSLKKCYNIAREYQITLAVDNGDIEQIQRLIGVEYYLQTLISDTSDKIQKMYEQLQNEKLEDASALSSAVSEAKNCIVFFMKERFKDPSISKALECVDMTILCSLNKRYVMMEAAASGAGDCLIDLTSRDGGWFLDEMYILSSSVVELLNLLKGQTDLGSKTHLCQAMACVQGCHDILHDLQELNLNFVTIILPEALKTIQAEEPSVLNMMTDLSSVIQEDATLPDLINKLEMHLRCLIMDMESPHSDSLGVVGQIRKRFMSLLTVPEVPDNLSPGQMLIMGFNGLFDKLDMDFRQLRERILRMNIPSLWRKIDLVKEANSMLAPIFAPGSFQILCDIFLLRRIQTMVDFFSSCQVMANILKGSATLPPSFSDSHLMKHIKKFCADYVGHLLLGLPSQTLAFSLCMMIEDLGVNLNAEIEQRDVGVESKVPLEDMCRKAVDLNLRMKSITTSQLNQASSLVNNLDNAWRRQENARHLENCVVSHKATLQRIQVQLTAHQWIHEDLLIQSNSTNILPTVRSVFMTELRKSLSTLVTLQPLLLETKDQYNSLGSSVQQRLKWAAGANPALTEVLSSYEDFLKSDHTDRLDKLCTDVSSVCNAIIHYEALRTKTTEAMATDATFIQLLTQCRESCLVLETGGDFNVSPVEEKLMMLKPVGVNDVINLAWIQHSAELISEGIQQLQDLTARQQVQVNQQSDLIKKHVLTTRSLFTEHHKLMSDVRNLLRSMVKFEHEVNSMTHTKRYIKNYKIYSEKVSCLIKDIINKDLTEEAIINYLREARLVQDMTKSIYEDLINCGKPDVNDGEVTTSCVDCDGMYPKVAEDPTKVTRDPKTGKAIQERNSYALSVWHRVKVKLEGRDPDQGRRATVSEQVDYIIKEATNVDNLALLYEGWTPWV